MFHSSDLCGKYCARCDVNLAIHSFSYYLTFMREEYYARYEWSTRKLWHARFAALHSADKKISAAGPHSQSAILSAKPALLTNHQQSKISSVHRVQSFSRTDKLVPLFPQSSTQASLNTTPLTAFVWPPSVPLISFLIVVIFFIIFR